MRKLAHIIGAAAFVMAGCMQAASAKEKEQYRSCTAKDLPGAWHMVGMNGPGYKARKPGDANFHPHQWFVFSPDGHVRHLSSAKPISAEEREKRLKHVPAGRYALDQRAMLHIGAGKKKVNFQCFVNLREANHMQPGDIVLSSYDKKGHNKFNRVLRK